MAAALTHGMLGSMFSVVPASFKYHRVVSHEFGSMTEPLARLLQDGKGAAARLAAKHNAPMHDKSSPMMRRLLFAIHFHLDASFGLQPALWPWSSS